MLNQNLTDFVFFDSVGRLELIERSPHSKAGSLSRNYGGITSACSLLKINFLAGALNDLPEKHTNQYAYL